MALPTTASIVPRTTWHDIHGLWNAGVDIRGPTGLEIRLSYHRQVILGWTRSYAQPVIEALRLEPRNTLVVGGLIGIFPELLRDEHGWSDAQVACLDPCPWVVAEHSTTEEVDINSMVVEVGLRLATEVGKAAKGQLYDGGARCRVRFSAERLGSAPSVNAAKALFGQSKVDLVITDDGYLNYHSDAECVQILDAIDGIGATRVCHLVYEDRADGTPWNWGNYHSLAEWKAMRPAHEFCATMGSYEVR